MLATLTMILGLGVAAQDGAEPATPPGAIVALALQPSVGLSDDEAKGSQQKLESELAGLGVTVVAADPVDPACVPDPACVETARGDRPALLVVELVRVGPVVQLTGTASSKNGSAKGFHGLDEQQLKKGPLLPDEIRVWAKALVPEKAPPPPPPPPPPPEKKGGLAALTPMQTGGLFAGGAGALFLVTGVIMVAIAEPVLEDKTSSGAAKQSSAALGYVGLGATAIGVVGLGAAAVLVFVLPSSKPVE